MVVSVVALIVNLLFPLSEITRVSFLSWATFVGAKRPTVQLVESIHDPGRIVHTSKYSLYCTLRTIYYCTMYS